MATNACHSRPVGALGSAARWHSRQLHFQLGHAPLEHGQLRLQRRVAPRLAPVAFAVSALPFGVGQWHGWFSLCVTGISGREGEGRKRYA
jgi:hypothetical protein